MHTLGAPGSGTPSDRTEQELDTGVDEPSAFSHLFQSYDIHALLLKNQFLTSARLQTKCAIDFLHKPTTVRLLLEAAFVVPCDDDYIKHFLLTEALSDAHDHSTFDASEVMIEDIQKPVLAQLEYYTCISRSERIEMCDSAADLLDICLASSDVISIIRNNRLLQHYPFSVISGRNCFPIVRSLDSTPAKRRVPLHVCRNFSRLIRSLCAQASSAELLLEIFEESVSICPLSNKGDNWNYLNAWMSNPDDRDIMGSLIPVITDAYSLFPLSERKRLTKALMDLHLVPTLSQFLTTANLKEVPVDTGQMISEVLSMVFHSSAPEELKYEAIQYLPSIAESVFSMEHSDMDGLRAKYAGRTLVAGVRAIIHLSRSLYEETYGRPPSSVSKDLKKLDSLKSTFQKILATMKGVGYRLKLLIREGVERAMQSRAEPVIEPLDTGSPRESTVMSNLAQTVMDSLSDLHSNATRSIISEHDEDIIKLKGAIPSPDHPQFIDRHTDLIIGTPKPMGQFTMIQYAIMETLSRLLLLAADLRDFLYATKNTDPYSSLVGVLNTDYLNKSGGISNQPLTPFPFSATMGVGGADIIDLKKTFSFHKGGYYPISPIHIAECYAKNGIPDAILLTMMAYPDCSICHFLGTRILIPMIEYNGYSQDLVQSVLSETYFLRFLDLYTGQNMDDLATSFALSTTSIGVFIVSIAANIVRIAGNVPDSRWQNRKLDNLVNIKSSTALCNSTQSITIPLTVSELPQAIKTSSSVSNIVLQKILRNTRFNAFSEKVLRINAWTHFTFHDSADSFESMMHQQLSPSPCVEPPPSPLKLPLRESLQNTRREDDKKSRGKAIPIIPQTQSIQKTYNYNVRKRNDGVMNHVGHCVSRNILSGLVPSFGKQFSTLSSGTLKVSNEHKLARVASYGNTISNQHNGETYNEPSVRSISLGQRITQRSAQFFPILRCGNGRGVSGSMLGSLNREYQPLMSIRTFKDVPSDAHHG